MTLKLFWFNLNFFDIFLEGERTVRSFHLTTHMKGLGKSGIFYDMIFCVIQDGRPLNTKNYLKRERVDQIKNFKRQMEVLGNGNRSGTLFEVLLQQNGRHSLKLVYKANRWTDFHDSNGK